MYNTHSPKSTSNEDVLSNKEVNTIAGPVTLNRWYNDKDLEIEGMSRK